MHTRSELKNQEELARMMKDPLGKFFTTAMTDQCFRSERHQRIAAQMVYLLKQHGIPSYLSFFKRVSLYLFRSFGTVFSFIMVPVATFFLRRQTNGVIIRGETKPLLSHIKERKKEGIRLNMNHLGEAILGEQEALRRLNVYLEDLRSPDIDYVSVKISTIYSQINLLSWDYTVEKIAERLRSLYREALKHSTDIQKFVNLDMEEYRDLPLTKAVFMKVLNEPEFLRFSAGIVLQAYVPDAFLALKELTEWAKERVSRGGAPIKVRIVKGANMAMEQFEASLRSWPQAPYKTKSETDANYKKMVDFALTRENCLAVHIGVASHNIFDLAYALILRSENKVDEAVNFEMLEGMANHVRRVVQELSGGMLLYCAVATREDFQSAIAYLIRRLDENTGAQNFLAHSFGLKKGSTEWHEQEKLFSKACSNKEGVFVGSRREQNRLLPAEPLPLTHPFANEADTDFSLAANREWALHIIETWKNKKIGPIGEHPTESGVNPSNPREVLYLYSLMGWDAVNQAIERAKGISAPYPLLSKIAQKLREHRADLIGAALVDGGKLITEADVEVSEAIDFCEYYLRSHQEMAQHTELKMQPKGIVLVTPPWNFPIAIPCGGIIAALVTGNAVLFKPARETFYIGYVLANLLWDAGVPKEALQLIACDSKTVGSQMIQDQRISAVILTGATSTAELFKKLRPSLDLSAETGGKNAIIITDMADRDLAIKELIQSAFGHGGQKCSAASLAVLEKAVYDDPHFRHHLKDAVESLKVGPAWDLTSKIGPLIHSPDEKLFRALTTLEEGEEWLVKPKPCDNNPNLWTPGVKLGVKEGSYTHLTEFFGPVLGLMRAHDLDDAIRIVNMSPYGLTSGLQSLDIREQHHWIKKIVAGNLYINRGITGAIVRRQPFGGTKKSCFGHGAKAGGPNYLSQFMHITQESLPKDRHRTNDYVARLTDLLNYLDLSDIELAVWTSSIDNYAYWWNQFNRLTDPSLIVGQDNLFKYAPHTRMAMRMEDSDRTIDFLRIFAAALTTHTKLTLSVNPSDINWGSYLPFFTIKEESHEEFIKGLSQFERVRLASPPSENLIKKAAEVGCYLDAVPVLASGRFELLHYVREISLSIDYHRYGNLGLREKEERSPIL